MADYSVEEGFSGREDGVEERFAPGTLVEKDRQETTRVTLKFDDAFFLADASGDVLASTREMGLFWRGKRFLSVCNLFLEGQPLVTFSHYVADRGDTCLVDLTNAAFTTVDGMEVRQRSIHVRRVVELRHEQLVQTLTITSYTALAVPLALGLKIGAMICTAAGEFARFRSTQVVIIR